MPKLEITEVTYATLKNTGNYENERVELTAKVRKGEDPNDVLVALKEQALDALFVLSRVKASKKK